MLLLGLLWGALSTSFWAAGFGAGGFRGRFRGHVGLSFCGFAAAGRGRGVVRREIVRFCQSAGAGRLSFSRLLGALFDDANPI